MLLGDIFPDHLERLENFCSGHQGMVINHENLHRNPPVFARSSPLIMVLDSQEIISIESSLLGNVYWFGCCLSIRISSSRILTIASVSCPQ